MSEASFHQAAHLLAFVGKKDPQLEQLQRLYSSGLLSDLFDGNIDEVNRDKFRAVLGLKPLSPDHIHVDRSVRPVYPDFTKKGYIDTPEFIRLEATGPSVYPLRSLRPSLHPKQEQGVATGYEVYEYQKLLGLEGCLGLSDLLAIQKLGIAPFRRHWKGKAVSGWKSVVQDGFGRLDVPYLVEDDGQVFLFWGWLGLDWDARVLALRFDK